MEQQLIDFILSGKVPTLSIVFSAISLVCCVAIPVVLMIIFLKKCKCSIKPFFVGAGTFILFALILESMVHKIALGGAFGVKIASNFWLLGLYGGVMAGLFEEFGRYFAMRLTLKDCFNNDKNSLMYGAGHGGIECIILLGLTMVSNIFTAISINNGTVGLSINAIQTLAESDRIANLSGMASLISSPSYIFLIGLIERIAAVTGHIGLSVIVWYSVKNKKSLLLVLAIFLHALLDAGTVWIKGLSNSNVVLIEVAAYVLVAVIWAFAIIVMKKNRNVEA